MLLALVGVRSPRPAGSWAVFEVVRVDAPAGEVRTPDVAGDSAPTELSVETTPEQTQPALSAPAQPPPAPRAAVTPAPEPEPDPIALPEVEAQPDAAAAEAIAALRPDPPAPTQVAAVEPRDEPVSQRTDASVGEPTPGTASPPGRPLAGFEAQGTRSGAPDADRDDPALAVWTVRVQAHLTRSFLPPPDATAGARLACRMRLHIDPHTGEVLSATIVTSSGHATWDAAAVAAVQAAGGVPAPPPSVWHLLEDGVDIRFAPR